MGLTLPVENPSVEIFTKVVENSNYGPLADKAQYKIGLVLKGLERYYDAEEAFTRLIKSYPRASGWTRLSFRSPPAAPRFPKVPITTRGRQRMPPIVFRNLWRCIPMPPWRRKPKNISALNDKQALSDYNSGRFYERQGDFGSAKIYYNGVVNSYPDSVWAVRSLERLQILERRRK